MRQVVLDTETTGLSSEAGDRIVEIGCVELVHGVPSGRTYQQYINPERDVPEEVVAVHGLSEDFLSDHPPFANIVEELMEFLDDSALVIHNAEFDIGFLNNELVLMKNAFGRIEDNCVINDTLQLARKLHPGQRNSLDALCKRYSIDNSHRTVHGALLDAQLLVEVYLAMTGGQTDLYFGSETIVGEDRKGMSEEGAVFNDKAEIRVILPNKEEIKLHQEWISILKTDNP